MCVLEHSNVWFRLRAAAGSVEVNSLAQYILFRQFLAKMVPRIRKWGKIENVGSMKSDQTPRQVMGRR